MLGKGRNGQSSVLTSPKYCKSSLSMVAQSDNVAGVPLVFVPVAFESLSGEQIDPCGDMSAGERPLSSYESTIFYRSQCVSIGLGSAAEHYR